MFNTETRLLLHIFIQEMWQSIQVWKGRQKYHCLHLKENFGIKKIKSKLHITTPKFLPEYKLHVVRNFCFIPDDVSRI